MVRWVFSCLWLAACAASGWAVAQTGTVARAADAPAPTVCAPACSPGAVPDCALLGVASDLAASPAPCQAFQAVALPSAWAHYRPWRDEAVGDWPQANATVARIGGWRVYARETATTQNTSTSSKDAP